MSKAAGQAARPQLGEFIPERFCDEGGLRERCRVDFPGSWCAFPATTHIYRELS